MLLLEELIVGGGAGTLFDLKLQARLVSLVIFSSINRSPIEFSLIQKDITRWRSKLYLHVPRSSYTYITFTWESSESSFRYNYDESIPFGTRQSALAHWAFAAAFETYVIFISLQNGTLSRLKLPNGVRRQKRVATPLAQCLFDYFIVIVL